MKGNRETRMHVVRALDRLMEATPIDKIKVTALCKEAGIARATFYGNFENLYTVATWYWDQILEDSLYLIGSGLSFYEAHLKLFEAIAQNRQFFNRAFRTSDYNSIRSYGDRIMADFYCDLLVKQMHRSLTPREALVVRVFTAGAATVTSEWTQDSIQGAPAFIARALTDSLPCELAPWLESANRS